MSPPETRPARQSARTTGGRRTTPTSRRPTRTSIPAASRRSTNLRFNCSCFTTDAPARSRRGSLSRTISAAVAEEFCCPESWLHSRAFRDVRVTGSIARELPIPHRPIELAADGKIRTLVRKLRGKRLVEIDPVAWRFRGMEISIREAIPMWKHVERGGRVRHVLLDAEVRDGNVEVERRAHRDRREVCRTVTAHLHVIQVRECRNLLQRGDAAAVNRHAEIVDQLFGDQELRIPDGVEDLADGERRRGVLTDDAESLLKFRRDGILHPEQMMGLERLSKTRRLDGSQAVMHVVQQVNILTERLPQLFEERWNKPQVFFG